VIVHFSGRLDLPTSTNRQSRHIIVEKRNKRTYVLIRKKYSIFFKLLPYQFIQTFPSKSNIESHSPLNYIGIPGFHYPHIVTFPILLKLPLFQLPFIAPLTRDRLDPSTIPKLASFVRRNRILPCSQAFTSHYCHDFSQGQSLVQIELSDLLLVRLPLWSHPAG
jgi:hypothetical protein